MGYVAVSGGHEAIDASLDLLERRRVSPGRSIDVDLIAQVLPELVEQVQSEGSLWCPEVAATRLLDGRGSHLGTPQRPFGLEIGRAHV